MVSDGRRGEAACFSSLPHTTHPGCSASYISPTPLSSSPSVYTFPLLPVTFPVPRERRKRTILTYLYRIFLILLFSHFPPVSRSFCPLYPSLPLPSLSSLCLPPSTQVSLLLRTPHQISLHSQPVVSQPDMNSKYFSF